MSHANINARLGTGYTKGIEIRSLTGLRGIAAVYVVLYHLSPSVAGNSALSIFANHGYLAVDLFFILSGYVLSLTYGHLFQNGVRLNAIKIFMVRRIARLFPLYLVVTLLAVALMIADPIKNKNNIPIDSLSIFSNLLMVQSWGLQRSFVGAAWSISVEMVAYVLFPMFCLMIIKRRSVSILIACAVTSFSAVVFLAYGVPHDFASKPLDITDAFSIYPLLRCLSEFVIGMTIYGLDGAGKHARIFENSLLQILAAGAFIIFLAMPMMDVFAVLAGCCIIAMIARDGGIIASLLKLPALHWLGIISYSLYLLHSIVGMYKVDIQMLFESHGAPHAYTLSQAAVFGLSILFGWIFYHCIEKPARKYFRQHSHLASKP